MGNLCLKLNISESRYKLQKRNNQSLEKIKKEFKVELSQGFHKSINYKVVNRYAYNLQTETWEKKK